MSDKVIDKVTKHYPEFVEEVVGLSVNDLNNRLAQFAKDSQALEDTKEADVALEEARKTVSYLSEPYQDAKKAVKLKSRYIIDLIKERGGA